MPHPSCIAALTRLTLRLSAAPHVSPRRPRPVRRRSRTPPQIALGLRKLGVVGSVLYVAAHPDDENTALLAYLANGALVRTAYLSVTRGDGGQNLIGSEQGPELGLIRTQELLAARRIDGAEQFFTRARDFGFSKSPEETLRIWGKEAVLADVVAVIRTLPPRRHRHALLARAGRHARPPHGLGDAGGRGVSRRGRSASFTPSS